MKTKWAILIWGIVVLIVASTGIIIYNYGVAEQKYIDEHRYVYEGILTDFRLPRYRFQLVFEDRVFSFYTGGTLTSFDYQSLEIGVRYKLYYHENYDSMVFDKLEKV